MKNYILQGILLLSLQTLLAQTKLSDEQLIRNARAASNAAIAKRDMDGIAKFWLPDFVQVRGNGTSEKGKDAIIKIWNDMFKTNPTSSFVRTPSEVIISEGDGMMAWEKGAWEGINSYSKGGNYSAMWRKKDGEWKIQAELFVALR
jgi:uncharacterized protein (TIGR02246 family)